MEGVTYAELAEELGMTKNSLYVLVHRYPDWRPMLRRGQTALFTSSQADAIRSWKHGEASEVLLDLDEAAELANVTTGTLEYHLHQKGQLLDVRMVPNPAGSGRSVRRFTRKSVLAFRDWVVAGRPDLEGEEPEREDVPDAIEVLM